MLAMGKQIVDTMRKAIHADQSWPEAGSSLESCSPEAAIS